jgi:NADPH2:quinone reductase
VLPAERAVKLPPYIASNIAAAVTLQGLTAQYLIHATHSVQAGEHILVHAAAGGVGQLLCQWASHLGAIVIGVVSTPEKSEVARANGASHVIVGTKTLPAEVRRITAGEMVPVVYDSIGRDTFLVSLDCLAPLGLMVSYGNASGAVPPFELSLLSAKGSLFITRPTLATYTAKRSALQRMAADVFQAVRDGILTPHINQSFPLAEAAAAHRALEGRKTTGQVVLIP